MQQIKLGRKLAFEPNDYETLNTACVVKRNLIRSGHAHFRERTESGNTSRAIAALASSAYNHPEWQESPDAIVVFDLAGDKFLFHHLLELARSDKEGNRPHRFLSLEDEDDWDYFEPFSVMRGDDRLIKICNLLGEAFHSERGLVSGEGLYTPDVVTSLFQITRDIVVSRAGGKAEKLSFSELAQYIQQEKDGLLGDVRHALAFLTETPQLQPPDDTHNCIDFHQTLRDGELNYFYLPAVAEGSVARLVAGLGLCSLVNAAMERKMLGLPQRHVFCIVRDFQDIAGPNFSRLLTKASSCGISLIMSNQTTAQLQRSFDLGRIVREHTSLKVYFSVGGNEDINELQGLFKESPGASESQNSGQTVSTDKRRDILEVAGTNNQAFVIVEDGKGHKSPTAMEFETTISDDEFESLKNKPLPHFQGENRRSRVGILRDQTTAARWQKLHRRDAGKSPKYHF